MVDGTGYIIQGDEGEIGIDLSNRHNVTMGNMDVSGFVYGIYLNGASTASPKTTYPTTDMASHWLILQTITA